MPSSRRGSGRGNSQGNNSCGQTQGAAEKNQCQVWHQEEGSRADWQIVGYCRSPAQGLTMQVGIESITKAVAVFSWINFQGSQDIEEANQGDQQELSR